MTLSTEFISMQPRIPKKMAFFLQTKSSWDSHGTITDIIFEEFSLASSHDDQTTLFPDGFTVICFEFIPDHPEITTACFLGRMTDQKKIVYRKNKHYFAIKIPPKYFFSDPPLESLDYTNQICPLDRLNPRFQDFPYHKISQGDFHQRIGLFQAFVSENVALSESKIINSVIDKSLLTFDPATIQEIAHELEYSDRYIRKIFLEKLGISPKKLLQVIKLQQLMASLLSDKNPLTDIFLSNAFYDQSHFNRFFKSQTSYTPTEFRELMQ